MAPRESSWTPGVDARAALQRRGGNHPGRIEKARDPSHALARLAGYLAPHAGELAFVMACIVLSSLAGLAGPRLIGLALDRDIPARDSGGLARTAALMLAAWLASNALSIAANRVMARISQYALRKLRSDLFSHLQTLPMSFFDTRPAGGLMSRLTNDIEAINQAVSQNVTSMVAGTLTMAGILAAMFSLNHWLAMASLVVVPIMLGFTRFVAHFTRKGFRRLQKDLGELNAVAEEALGGQRVIRAFGRSGSMLESFRAANRAVYESGVYANSFAMLLMPLTQVLGTFFVVAIASLGGWIALKGLASVGTIAAFISYGQGFTQPLRQIANLYNSIQAALAGAERVFEIMDTRPEPGISAPTAPAGAPPAGAPARIRGDVAFRDVTFGYDPGRPVIRSFSLDVPAGSTIALVGPTGAGKTTIINLLARFYEIGEGCIAIDGADIRNIPKATLRGMLGVVLQDSFLFADTVMENIRYGRPQATDEECIEAARMAEADHFIRQLPQGYGTLLSARAGNLSQGQRQLIAIARAILSDPSILVLDEATSSVDTRTEARIQAALLRLMRGRTSFVIAHRLSTIRDADLVVVIREGEIAEQGSHDSLMERRGFYWQLYMSQFKGHAI